jgi:hypothetical protein
MSTVPEADLQRILRNVASATAGDQGARRTAARWFNRLYFDVRRWNTSFIEFLHTYPGFSNCESAPNFGAFVKQLKEYRESLEERYGTVKNDLCTSLKVLSARYPKDFGWLFKQDRKLYYELRELIDDTYASENRIVGIAYGVCQFMHSVSPYGLEWHKEHHKEIVARITAYEDTSKQEVAAIKEMADSVGIHLLDIAEYEAILNNEGSSNPQIMVIGEVTMSQDNINIHNVVGPVNVKARLDRVTQIVKNAPAIPTKEKDQLADLIDQLKHALEAAAEKQPEDLQRVIQAAEMVAAEVSKQKPSKSFLALSAEGLKEAAKAVAGIAPTVLNVATQIVQFVGKLF